jgi:hypothetical protein
MLREVTGAWLCATVALTTVVTTSTTSHPVAHHGSGIAAVRQATRPLRNLQRAEDAGYELFTDKAGIACIDMPAMGGMSGMGGMGVHFVKSALVGDPNEAVRRPEAMVYRKDKSGELRLAAVEYVVLVDAWHAKHPHSAPKLFGHTFAFTAAGNRYGLPAYYSLHAWAWYQNPAGTFAPYNPRVTC